MADKDQSDYNSVLNSLQNRYGRTVFPITLPINEGPDFNTVADVLRKEIFTFENNNSGKFTQQKAEGEWSKKLNDYHTELIELIAESDEKLLEIFFENGE